MSRTKDLELFAQKVHEYRYDFHKLVYIIFPFGEPGSDLEFMAPAQWQLDEWRKMGEHFKDPAKFDIPYKLAVSSGNGSWKTAFGSMTLIMLLYTQKLRARITANTHTQLKQIVWPEVDVWCTRARFFDVMFEKAAESIKSKDEKYVEQWRADVFTWDITAPAAISGLHNKGNAVLLWFEESATIPAAIWQYANGAMTDTGTMKVWLAVANSDDPESALEQKMASPDWHSLRIDTRTLPHVSKDFIAELLRECGGNEDADDFRVRVRGLPRKSSSDAIISAARVQRALNSKTQRSDALPMIMTCDPAWSGGDETVIWLHQGNWSCLMDRYKLNKEHGDTHMYTYSRMCQLEKKYGVDHVFIDQAEGTTLYTLAQAAFKDNWELVSFSSSANDTPDFATSQYQNIRAQMYYEAEKWLAMGGCIESVNPDWIQDISKQLSWTKGIRNKTSLKKQAEPKAEIKIRVGQSPDISDAFVLRFARTIYDRLPQNMSSEMKALMNEQNESQEYDPYANM